MKVEDIKLALDKNRETHVQLETMNLVAQSSQSLKKLENELYEVMTKLNQLKKETATKYNSTLSQRQRVSDNIKSVESDLKKIGLTDSLLIPAKKILESADKALAEYKKI